jgi:hypothetical protein
MSDPVPTGSVKGRAPEGWEDELNAAWGIVNSLRAEVERLRAELAKAEPVLVAADRIHDAYAAMLLGRDLGRLPDWTRAALAGSPLVSGEPQAKGSE